MKAAELKKQAAQAARTSTAVIKLAKQLALIDADYKVLQRAAAILASAGSKIKSEAISAKRKEVAQEKAIAVATVEAKKIFATWPQKTILDKTVIISASPFGEGGLSNYLEEKKGRDLEWYLNTVFETAKRDIVEWAGYKAAVDGKPIIAVMEHARQRLEILRAKSKVQEMAKQWEHQVSSNG